MSDDSTSSQVLQEEVNERGKVLLKDYKTFFSYSIGGLWGIAIVVFLHIIIHGATVAVSVYLGLALSDRY